MRACASPSTSALAAAPIHNLDVPRFFVTNAVDRFAIIVVAIAGTPRASVRMLAVRGMQVDVSEGLVLGAGHCTTIQEASKVLPKDVESA